ncbi:hypothetical protein [Parapedobacter tibetensis]|uniref:hypothetical protein n=1 Tax=Parapedobacter tibetensis TaxID=2972951 RepID=UPI00214D511B|nr:hypothetical protein [Parapedobacter tibetensis]
MLCDLVIMRIHIDVLFEHAADEQLIKNYPWPKYVAYHPSEKEVGLVMLYAIEFIRQPNESSVRDVYIHDRNNAECGHVCKEIFDRKGNNPSAMLCRYIQGFKRKS